MRKRRAIELFSISFLDLLSGALGAVIILYVAIPKNLPVTAPKDDGGRRHHVVRVRRAAAAGIVNVKGESRSGSRVGSVIDNR